MLSVKVIMIHIIIFANVAAKIVIKYSLAPKIITFFGRE